MLNPQAKAAAVLKGPDGRTVSEVVPDARNWRCVVDSIRKRWRSSGQPASWRGSRAVAVAILPTNVGEWAVYLGNVSLNWSTGPHPTLSSSDRAPTADRSKTPARITLMRDCHHKARYRSPDFYHSSGIK